MSHRSRSIEPSQWLFKLSHEDCVDIFETQVVTMSKTFLGHWTETAHADRLRKNIDT